MEETAVAKLMTRRRWLVRGESVIASTGLALAVILLGAMAASAWWTVRSQRQNMQQVRSDQVRSVGSLLAQTAESLLASGELSTLRRMVIDIARSNELSACRIVLNNGVVIADSDPSNISVHRLPETWTEPSSLNQATDDGQSQPLHFPFEVADRGAARVELAQSAMAPAWELWESQAGLGMIGAGGLLALLVIYRRMRLRMWAMGAIREALLDLHSGEHTLSALEINAAAGPEATAWNQLLLESDHLRKQLLAQQIHEAQGEQRAGGNDLEGVCDAMWHGLLLIDDQLRIKYANGAAAVLLRANREEMIGCDVNSLAVDESLLEPVRNVVNGSVRRRVTSEVRLEGENGSVLRFNVRPVRRGDTAAAMVIIEDVTQQRLAEEARNTFVAQATHELRMPLTNIRLYTETALEMSDELSANENAQDAAHNAESRKLTLERSRCLNVINQESRRLERIVGDMLSVAEIEAGTLKLRSGDVRLETLFDELNADYQAQAAEKNITLTFNLPPKLPAIKGDRDKIVLALHNLIGNALKYTPPNGSVTVTVEVTDSQLVIEVTDTGIGISEDEAELIFEKFYRSKDHRIADISGSGLGLAVAREVIRLHRGDITVRSQLNQGTTFVLTVPTMLAAA